LTTAAGIAGKARVLASQQAVNTWILATEAHFSSIAAPLEVAFGYSTNVGVTWSPPSRYTTFFPTTAIAGPWTIYDLANQSPGLGLADVGLVNRSAQRMPPLALVATVGGARGWLFLVGPDARRSTRMVAISSRTCRAEDAAPSCVAGPMPTPGGCVPNPRALASACVTLAAPLNQALLMRSADDGTSFAPAVAVDPVAMQSLAHAIVVTDDSAVAVLYETDSQLKVALFDGAVASLPRISEAVLVSDTRPRAQAQHLGLGAVTGAAMVAVGRDLVVAYSLVDPAAPNAPVALSPAAAGSVQRHDDTLRSTMQLVRLRR
jgi:hypothetical protein